MGDGDATRGGDATGQKLAHLPYEEVARIRDLPGRPEDVVAAFADACRLNALYAIKRAGSGHIGTSFSCIDVVAWLLSRELRLPERGDPTAAGDVYFSSKGHDAPALYSVLAGLGLLPFDRLSTLRTHGGLPGHPDVGTPYVFSNTGSLGMGISKAKGMVQANRRRKLAGRVVVLTGDGELQEGQIWESLPSAVRDRMGELTVVVDWNRIQSDTWVKDVSDPGDLAAKFRAFGWHVETCDGHDLASFARAFASASAVRDRPHVVLAETVKGRGVSFMEGPSLPPGEWRYRYHSGAPSDEEYGRAVAEILARLASRLQALGAAPPRVVETPQPEHRAIQGLERLVPAYSRALLEAAERDPRVVVLDADLILDCGLIPFRDRFPDRFVECGIAEQDMVSQAGGMAMRGLLPVAHSFSAFLSARPNEQIYNNATEGRKVVYVATLAGLLPGGPGHSHQSVRDVSALAAIPGLLVLAPANEAETSLAVDFALYGAPESVYLRLSSVAWDVPFTLPEGYRLEPGRGVPVAEGADAVLFAYGPALLSEAVRASRALAADGIGLRVVNLPWLNRVDPRWLESVVGPRRFVFTLDDHYVRNGQGEMVAATLAGLGTGPVVHRFGVETLPAGGKNDEVLRAHGLDAASLAKRVRKILGGRA